MSCEFVASNDSLLNAEIDTGTSISLSSTLRALTRTSSSIWADAVVEPNARLTANATCADRRRMESSFIAVSCHSR